MKYCRPREETGYTPADLVMHDGFGRTAIFEILNLTPYNIRYTSALTDQTDLNRLTNKAFAFAPVGVPSVIPSAATGTTEQMSVYLGLWLSRVAPPDPLKSAVIADIFNIVNEVTSLLAFVIDPLNPPQPNDGVKMYVSTYPLPTFDRECFQRNNSSAWVNTGNTGTPDQYLACTPGTTVGESSDGCKAQWADTDSGPAPADGGRGARSTRVPSRGGSHAAAAQADHQAGGEVPARPDQAVAAAHPGFAKGGLNHVDATYPRGYAGVGRGIGAPSREPDGPRSVPIGRRAQRRHLHLLQRGADFHDYARQPDGLPAGQQRDGHGDPLGLRVSAAIRRPGDQGEGSRR